MLWSVPPQAPIGRPPSAPTTAVHCYAAEVSNSPNAIVRVLFVCVGNVCRSPLAERLLSQVLKRSIDCTYLEIRSAGIRGLSGLPMEGMAATELERLGGNAEGFAARRIDSQTIGEADLILTMTREVRAEVLREQPRAVKRCFTLPEFAHLCRHAVEVDAPIFTLAELVAFAARNRSHASSIEQDVPDPIGRSSEVHRQVADLIAANVSVVSALLVPLLRGPETHQPGNNEES